MNVKYIILKDIQTIGKFILQYAESKAILLPGRILGYKKDDIKISPSSITKRAVWKLYQSTATNRGATNKAATEMWVLQCSRTYKTNLRTMKLR